MNQSKKKIQTTQNIIFAWNWNESLRRFLQSCVSSFDRMAIVIVINQNKPPDSGCYRQSFRLHEQISIEIEWICCLLSTICLCSYLSWKWTINAISKPMNTWHKKPRVLNLCVCLNLHSFFVCLSVNNNTKVNPSGIV